nr:hypothetical protein [Tanacetum cinerariifolium]
LSGSYIHYALTVNPHIYISCIKQFWNTASVKRSGDVTRLQALVNKKKIVISEAVIHEILQLNDAEGVVLANMRRVGKGFSMVETPLFEGMLAVGQPAEEGLVATQVQVDDVAAAAPSSPQAPPQDAEFLTQLQQVLNICFALSKHVENLENDNAAQKLVIVKLKARVKKLEKDNQIKSSKFRRLRKVGASRRVDSSDDMEDAEIYNLDLDHSSKVLSMQEDDSEVQEVVEVVTTTKLITEVITAAASQVSAASTTIPAASAIVPAAKPTIPAAAPTVVAAYTRRRKGVIIRDPEEELSLKTLVETPKVKDKGKGILVETPKPLKKKDQIEMDAEYARKLQEEIDRDHDGFNKDIDRDAAMDHVNKKIQFDENIRFLFKSREEMEAEDQEIIKSINETPAQKAAKRRKLSEEAQEAEDLRKRLEVVEDDDDDVFVDATPLAQKVPVVNYHIVLIDNKPRWTRCYMEKSKECSWFGIGERWKLLTSCGVHVITISTV